ncbi:MAG TPA: cytochrome P450 [Solirubrobacteraceae bacterium]
MSVLTRPAPPTRASGAELLGAAEASPAGAISAEELATLPSPPRVRWPRPVQVLWFGQRQASFMFHYRGRFGEVWSPRGYVPGQAAVTGHPDHIRSLFKAPPDQVPTLAAESPLRPVLGPSSVLTSNGPRHLRQRKLLLPPFHGEAIARYEQMIADAASREIGRWPVGRPFSLAPRMQAITLDVIMAGIFGIEGSPSPGTVEHALRLAIRELLRSSTMPGAKLAEWMNIGRDEPFGLTWFGLLVPDRCVYAIIRKRRREADLEQRTDILSLIMRARTEEGQTLTDKELRDELMTLVLAGHETTANQLAWAWERLVRTPAAHQRLLEAVRSDEDADQVIESTITEAMRVRPVIPITGRRVSVPWRLGHYGVPPGTPVAASILLLHHREDVYPDPFAFRPERWEGRKPGTYEWIPFGGGTRRCLGAALAMAEQRVVLRAMAGRLDLEADDPKPERPKHRNVTMIPARGGRVILRARR